ncbi:MAG: 50S ribosomal protein L13 [Nanoarchaeota archaeon]|nr:50S ribosomal protein L13 [Nanoarchaeota archaeon]
MIINGENLILGRLASIVAKKALLGEKIDIVNADKVVVVGSKRIVEAKYTQKRNRTTPVKGPFISRMADRFVRRAIRDMLPYKKERGREAFERIMCHIGVPDNFKNEKIETLDNVNVLNTSNIQFITIEKICKLIGRQ